MTALQRTAGNRATAGLLSAPRPAASGIVVQRARVPGQAELAVLLPAGGANVPAHLRGLNQVVQNVLTETDPTLGLTAAEHVLVHARALGALSPPDFAALPLQERLTRLAEAIENIRPDRAVRDPALMRSGTRPGTTDAANVAALVTNVGTLIDDILAASDIDLWLEQIFGAGNGGFAKARYRLAKVFLNRLASANRILSDRSGYSEESGLGGSTISGRSIELTPQTIDNPGDLGNQILTLHEAMHAGNELVDDFGYIGEAGFTGMSHSRKLRNAAHYEVAAHRLRDPGNALAFPDVVNGGFLTFTPATSTGPGATLTVPQDARNHASDLIENAWAGSLDLYDQWARVYRNPRLWPGMRGRLQFWSVAENLTVHEKTISPTAAVGSDSAAVSRVDLALSEVLSRRIALVQNQLRGADPVAFEAANASAAEVAAATNLATHRDLLVLCAVRAFGTSLTGDAARDTAVISRLGQAKAAENILIARPAAFP